MTRDRHTWCKLALQRAHRKQVCMERLLVSSTHLKRRNGNKIHSLPSDRPQPNCHVHGPARQQLAAFFENTGKHAGAAAIPAPAGRSRRILSPQPAWAKFLSEELGIKGCHRERTLQLTSGHLIWKSYTCKALENPQLLVYSQFQNNCAGRQR